LIQSGWRLPRSFGLMQLNKFVSAQGRQIFFEIISLLFSLDDTLYTHIEPYILHLKETYAQYLASGDLVWNGHASEYCVSDSEQQQITMPVFFSFRDNRSGPLPYIEASS
jgi:hypothetical protein